jgi:hypothetical protein
MSRRGRHGRNPHSHQAVRPARTGGPVSGHPPVPDAEVRLPARPEPASEPAARALVVPPFVMTPLAVAAAVGAPPPGAEPTATTNTTVEPAAPVPAVATPVTPTRGASEPVESRGAAQAAESADEGLRPTCTVAQLRRFIKSRPWVPMHELRRRFGINGTEDDVTPIRVGDQRLYIGMPPTEGHLMAELLGSGDVGYELSLDPGAPIVVGVYPMRPIPRS